MRSKIILIMLFVFVMMQAFSQEKVKISLNNVEVEYIYLDSSKVDIEVKIVNRSSKSIYIPMKNSCFRIFDSTMVVNIGDRLSKVDGVVTGGTVLLNKLSENDSTVLKLRREKNSESAFKEILISLDFVFESCLQKKRNKKVHSTQFTMLRDEYMEKDIHSSMRIPFGQRKE